MESKREKICHKFGVICAICGYYGILAYNIVTGRGELFGILLFVMLIVPLFGLLILPFLYYSIYGLIFAIYWLIYAIRKLIRCEHHHEWYGCKCKICGIVRDECHDWEEKRTSYEPYYPGYRIDGYRCSICGESK